MILDWPKGLSGSVEMILTRSKIFSGSTKNVLR